MSSRSKSGRDRGSKRRDSRPEDLTTRESSGDGQAEESTITAMITAHRGPLPSPDVMERYEQICPGAADRIIVQFEQVAKHQQALEVKAYDAQIEDDRADRAQVRIGQCLGCLIGMTAIITGGVTAIHGAEWAGGAIGGTAVAGLVSAFVVGRYSNPKK